MIEAWVIERHFNRFASFLTRRVERAVAMFILVCSPQIHANCERIDEPVDGSPASFDGPRAFGPLHGALTLDCLQYVSYLEVRGQGSAVVQDED